MTDQRYQEIMQSLGMPNSQSLASALKQVANEVEQTVVARELQAIRSCRPFGYVTTDNQGRRVFHSTKPHSYDGTTCVAVFSLADLPRQWSWADDYQ